MCGFWLAFLVPILTHSLTLSPSFLFFLALCFSSLRGQLKINLIVRRASFLLASLLVFFNKNYFHAGTVVSIILS